MSNLIIRKLLETQLNSITPSTLPTAWENLAFKPIAGSAWQRVNMLPAQTENPTMGEGFKREVGVLQVTLFYPLNEGPQKAMQRAEVIRAAFKRSTAWFEGTLRVLIERDPYISPAVVVDGAWYALPVSIPYMGDVFG